MLKHHSEERSPEVLQAERTEEPESSTIGEKLRAFQRAWFRAIALAWADATNLEALKQAPARFLATHCGYALPGSVDLTVREAREDGIAAAGWDPQRESWDLPRTVITLYVPPAPELSERDVALAELADPCDCIPVCT